MRRVGLLLSLVLVVGASTQARGQPATRPSSDPSVKRVEQLHIEGAALFRAGQYRQAAAKYEEAYRIFPEPNLLYNTGRCYEALGKIDEAIASYERFLALDEADAAVKRQAETKLQLLRRARRNSQTPEPTADPPAATDPPPPRRPASAAMRITKWVMLGAGVATAAGGTVAFILGARDHARVNDAVDEAGGDIISMTRVEALDLRASGNTKKWIGIGLWGAAGAAVITSGVLFALDGRSESAPQQSAALGVFISPRAVTVTGTF